MMKRREFLWVGGAGALGGVLSACGGGSGDGEGAQIAATDGRAQTLSVRRTSAAPTVVAAAATSGSVLIVGGGMAGVTAAKYLRKWSNGTIAVTLVERESRYTSNIMSSMVLSGQRTLESLRYSYDALRTRYGVTVLQGDVLGVDAAAASVRLADGRALSADRLVLAPGIDFDAVPGLADPLAMPHAWKAGAQTSALAKQLAAMPAGGTVLLTIPKTPYRCPPGPYERACLLADWLRQRKPGSKLIVLDANLDIVVERDNFLRAFNDLHRSVIEYVPDAEVLHADVPTKTLTTRQGPVRGDVINLIPRQKASPIIFSAGLANSADGRFAVVDVLNYASTAAPRVHVLGDSSSTTQPKAGHIANQEAKVCADAMVRLFSGGGAPDPAPVTNSACFSTITMTQASWLTAVFQYDATTRKMMPVPASSSASAGWNGDHFEAMGKWFNALMTDTFA